MATFDVIIVGGGPAGYVSAIRCAQLGLATAVVEQEKLGGVCVNIGCIPTKALLHSAYAINLLSHDAKALGIEIAGVKTDYGVAMKRSRQVSEQNSKGVEFLMKKHKVTVIKGTGVLQPGRKVKVGADVHEAKKAVVIATGSRVKGIPQVGLGINKTTVISSDEALFLEKAPATMAVVGAGAVGTEFADIFAAFGTKVTLIEALPRILPLEDAEASDVVAKAFKKRGIQVFAGAKVTKATVGQSSVTLEFEAGGKAEKLEVEKVLMAAGRAVNTENLGLDACGIKLTDRGFIQVNPKTLETTAAGLLLHRRRGRPSDAGAQGKPGRRRGRGDPGGAHAASDHVRQRAERHVLPSRSGEHRTDRGAVQGEEARLPGRQVPLLGQRARPGLDGDRRLRENHPGQAVRRDPRRAHRGLTRVGADSRAGRGAGERVHGRGSRSRHSRASDPVGGRGGGRFGLHGESAPYLRSRRNGREA